MSRARISLLVGAATLLLAGCSSAGGSGEPTWVPSPGFGTNGEGPGVQLTPIIPVPSLTPQRQPGQGPPGSTPSPGKTSTTDPNVVARHLKAPVGLTMMPDGSALVGERVTGRIVRVQPQPDKPVPTVRTLRGLDAAGDGGLLDLALSPTYAEDSLIYAYITTPTDNRVVDFTLTGPVTPVLTGIPKGKTDNTGRITFGRDHNLYIGTGDAGKPSLAPSSTSLAGKVLRVNDIGKPAEGNPKPSSSVWTSGHHVVDGLCASPAAVSVLEVEAGARGHEDELNVLASGDYYGWPASAGTIHPPSATLPGTDRGPGGCAILNGTVYLTSLDGKSLLSARILGTGGSLSVGPFSVALRSKYGRLKTVVAAADGALWLTTANRDGHGKPVADDERVIRYLPNSAGGSKNPA